MSTCTLPGLLIAILFLGCGPGTPLVATEADKTAEAKLIGSIESVPQVSPLQLKVKTRDGSRVVQCSEETVVVRGKQKVNRDTLRVDQYVVVSGTTRDKVLLASEIELVDAVEGKIEAIMEIFPLRLSVKTKKGDVSVQLEKETRVVRGKTEIDPGQLRNGDSVRVIGSSTRELFYAKQIDVDAKE